MSQVIQFPTKTDEQPDTDLVDFMGTLLQFHSVEAILRAMLAAATEYSDQQILQEIVDKL
jgi:hypothetical protein